jgi:hypothetical protein
MLALIAVLLVMLSFIPSGDAMDMPVRGASYVLSYTYTLRAIAMLLLLLWILYMVTVQTLFSAILTWLHITMTIVLAALIVFLFFFFHLSAGHTPEKEAEIFSFQAGMSLQMAVPLLIMLLLVVQLLYIINLFAGVIRRIS